MFQEFIDLFLESPEYYARSRIDRLESHLSIDLIVNAHDRIRKTNAIGYCVNTVGIDVKMPNTVNILATPSLESITAPSVPNALSIDPLHA